LAKYGEDIPTFAGAKSSPADVAPAPELPSKATAPVVQERAAPGGEQVPPAGGTEESLDWLTELEKLKTMSTASPPAATQMEETLPAPGVPEESPNWLAELQAARAEAAVAPTPEFLAPQAGGEAPPTIGTEEEPPAWLADLQSAQAESLRQAGMPASELTEQPGGETPPTVGGEEGGTDWLTSPRQYTIEAVEPSAGPTTMPEDAGPPAPADKPEELPDWLRELGLVQTPAKETSPSPLTSEMGELSQPATPFPEEHPASDKEGEEGAIPDWLNRLVTVTTPEPTPEERSEPPAEPAPFAPEVRAAAWLPRATAEEIEAASTAEPPPDEIPDWLHEMEMAQSAQGAAPSEETTPSPQVGAAEAAPSAPTASDEEPVPAWLDDLHALATMTTSPASQAEQPITAPIAEPDAAAVMPAEPEGQPPTWLAELQSIVESSPQVEPPAARDEDLSYPPAQELHGAPVPDWLRELGAQPTEPAHPVPPPAPAAQDLAPAEIPDWVARLSPPEETGHPKLKPAAVEQAAASPTTGQPMSEDEAIASLRARVGVPQVPDVEGATLFREIATELPESPPLPSKGPAMRGLAGTIIWALIFIAIILGIAVVLLAVLGRVEDLVGGSAFRKFLESPAAVGLVVSVQSFRDRLTALPPGAVVVMGTDYTPATGAEMEPIAQVILRDLLDHQARVVTVSLRPEGAAMAQRLLDRVNDDYPYGEYTLNLGYLPGETAGVRSLTFLKDMPLFSSQNVQSPQAGATMADSPAWRDVRGLDDVALVVEVADAAQPVRWWVEQVSPTPLAERPMLAAVSASALPVVRPYYSPDKPGQGRLQGLISGVTAAATYEIFLGQPGRAVRSVAAQSVVHLGLVVVALAGTIAGFRSVVAADRRR
jgi:hypothetical protein